MSKKAIINPRWLDVMLTAWGIDALNRMSGGYPGECPMFKERVDRPAASHDPEGYTAQDFRDLEAAINSLDVNYRLVITRAYKPWTFKAMTEALEDHYGCTDRTMQRWLHEAAAQLLAKMTETPLTTHRHVAIL